MDDPVTMRDPHVEARVASAAYAQARAVLEAEPEITAADLVDRLQARAAELAERLGAGPRTPGAPIVDHVREVGAPGTGSPAGLGDAAARVRDRLAAEEPGGPAS